MVHVQDQELPQASVLTPMPSSKPHFLHLEQEPRAHCRWEHSRCEEHMMAPPAATDGCDTPRYGVIYPGVRHTPSLVCMARVKGTCSSASRVCTDDHLRQPAARPP